MPDILDAHGLTDEVLIDKYLRPALEAEETRYIVTGGVNNAKIHSRKQPIWEPRLRALDMSFKLKGSYSASTEEGRGPSVQVIVLDVVRPDRSAITVQPMKKPADPSGNGSHD